MASKRRSSKLPVTDPSRDDDLRESDFEGLWAFSSPAARCSPLRQVGTEVFIEPVSRRGHEQISFRCETLTCPDNPFAAADFGCCDLRVVSAVSPDGFGGEGA